MMGALGGRLGALRDAFAGGDLDGVIDRNIYRGVVPGEPERAAVRAGLAGLREQLAAMPAGELIAGGWPA
jgi:cytochrome b pre-mRNA-processing protein 3